MNTQNENEKNICQVPQLVEKKEEKMSEASPNSEASQDKTQPQIDKIHLEIDTTHLVSPRTGTATSSPKNRN